MLSEAIIWFPCKQRQVGLLTEGPSQLREEKVSHRTLLIVAAVWSGGTVRADLITPDSISPVPTGWVSNEYKGLGLVFAPPDLVSGTYFSPSDGYGRGWESFLTSWNTGPDGALGPPAPAMWAGFQSASFVMPGTGAPATTNSLRVLVRTSWTDTVFTLQGYDLAGRPVASRDVLVSAYTDGWLTLRTSGMHSFEISSMWAPSVPGPWYNLPIFTTEAIEFYPVSAVPEPGGWVLSGLGILILTLARLRRGYRSVSLLARVILAEVNEGVVRSMLEPETREQM